MKAFIELWKLETQFLFHAKYFQGIKAKEIFRTDFCADAVRSMRPHNVIVFQTLFVCLSLVRFPVPVNI